MAIHSEINTESEELNSIIGILSEQICSNEKNLNNISDLVKLKQQCYFDQIKPSDYNCFVYDKIIQKEKFRASNDSTVKKVCDYAVIESKSNPVQASNNLNHLNKKIEEMKLMNNNITKLQKEEDNKKDDVISFCCFKTKNKN